MTGWIKADRWDPSAPDPDHAGEIYISVDNVQAVYEEVMDNGDIVTVINMITGQFEVSDDADEVLKKIRLSRPTRT